MLKLEVFECPDINRIGDYKFHFNQLTIGSNLKSQLVIDTPKKDQSIFVLEVTSEGKVYLLPPEGKAFLVNGKRFQAKKLVSIGDVFNIGDNLIRLKRAEYISTPNIDEYISDRLAKLKEEKSPLINLLKELQK